MNRAKTLEGKHYKTTLLHIQALRKLFGQQGHHHPSLYKGCLYAYVSHKQVDDIEGTFRVQVSTSETSTRTGYYQTRSSKQSFSLNIC